MSNTAEIMLPGTDDDRRERRVPVSINVGFRAQGSNPYAADVSDLSRHGFRVETHIPLAVDTYVWLRLPGLAPLAARVAWIKGHTLGCKFAAPLHPAVADMLIAQHRQDARSE